MSISILAMLAVPVSAFGADWTFWRGPDRNGTSPETGLISNWSPEGENLLWHAEFVGRSTPVVVDGRVCVIGRYGEKETIEQLEAARQQLVSAEKLAALGELTAGVAHEINNPIAVIQGNLDVLRLELGDDIGRE